MKNFLLLVLTTALLLPHLTKADTNHFGTGGGFELDLGDSEIPLTPKQERQQHLLKEKLKKKREQSLDQ